MSPAVLPASAVFLSYASQDAEAARALVSAMRAAGVEVWFDQNELVGGDAWDAKIRRQIAECALFVPVISANTQARLEGYFRIEWKLAAQRSHGIAEEKAFLLPVVIDDTRDSDAKVPAEFRAVQWTRLPSGEAPPAFLQRLQKLLHPANAVAPGLSAAQPPAAAAPVPKSRWPWLVAAGLGGAVLAVGLTVVLPTRPQPLGGVPLAPASPAITAPASTPAPTSPALDPKAIAVLPFANLSSEKDSEYFSDGLTENILDKLARNPGLRVMARTSSFSYKAKNAPISQIAAELRVGTIIEGSVQRAGTRLRITAQLVNGADGAHVWSETFDRELSTADIFAMQDEIALKIAARLHSGPEPSTAGSVVAFVPTRNLEAYDLFLRGRALEVRGTGGARQAIPLYQRAVELDPNFAEAWTRLAASWTSRANSITDYAPEAAPAARAALERAFSFNPDSAEALIVRAELARGVDFDFAAAERDLKRVEVLRGVTAELRTAQGQLARDQEDWPAALKFFEEATMLDPQNSGTLVWYGVVASSRGDFVLCDKLNRRAMAMQGAAGAEPFNNNLANRTRWRGPAASLALLERTSIMQARWDEWRVGLLIQLGRIEEARASVARLEAESAISRLGSKRTILSHWQALGRTEEARTLAETLYREAKAEFDRGNRGGFAWLDLINAQIALGDIDGSRTLLLAWKKEAEPWKTKAPYRYHWQFASRSTGAFLRVGMTEEAISLLQYRHSKGYHFGYGLGDRVFAPLRGDPRFEAIRREAEAYAAAQPDPVDP